MQKCDFSRGYYYMTSKLKFNFEIYTTTVLLLHVQIKFNQYIVNKEFIFSYIPRILFSSFVKLHSDLTFLEYICPHVGFK